MSEDLQDVRLPNGFLVRGVPVGVTKQEIIDKALANGFITQQDLDAFEMSKDYTAGWKEGLMDPFHGLAQMAEHAMPGGAAQKVSQFNNWLRTKPGFGWLAEVPEGGLDEYLALREQAIQMGRERQGETGMDWDRLATNIVNPANVAMAARAATIPAATLRARTAVGAGLGAASAGIQPVTQGDFAPEKAKQVGLGTVAGGMFPLAAEPVARVLRPATSKAVDTLRAAKVFPTVGSAVGGATRKFEDAATSVPILGDAILAAKERALTEFNRAAANRVLEPIGQTVPKSVKAGRDMVAYVRREASKYYDELLPNIRGVLDVRLRAQLRTIENMARQSNLDPKSKRQIGNIIQAEIRDKFTDDGLASGDTVKAIESALSRLVDKMKKSDDYDVMQVGRAIMEARQNLRDMVVRQNPQYGEQLQRANATWRRLHVVSDAASRAGTGRREGVFFPHQLASASRAGRGTTKADIARGRGTLQDLAEAGEQVLPSSLADSGTPRRMIAAGLMGGGAAYIEPAALAAMGVAAAPYAVPSIQRALTRAATARPGFMSPVAQTVRQFSPLLAPAGYPLASPLYE